MSYITQKGASGALSLTSGGTFQQSTDSELATLVGTRWDLSDGREVILVSTGSTTTATAGQLYQDAAVVPNHQNCAVASFTAYNGTTGVPATVVVTLGNTAITANQYRGGLLVVNAGTGIGQTLRIASHGAAAGSGTTAVVLEDSPNIALSVSDSKVCFNNVHGANVIVSPTTQTGAVAGVGLYRISPSSYGFMTSKGLTSCLSDALVAAVGQAISPSVTTAGTVTLSGSTTAILGYASQTAVSAEARTVFLNV